MRTNTDDLAPAEREPGRTSSLTDLKLRRLDAAVPPAEGQTTGSGSNAGISARQIFWGAHS